MKRGETTIVGQLSMLLKAGHTVSFKELDSDFEVTVFDQFGAGHVHHRGESMSEALNRAFRSTLLPGEEKP